jgi:act minimal PKS acyl carrier protein
MALFTLDSLQDIMRECAGEAESAQPFEQAPDEPFANLGYDSIALLETQSRINQDYGLEIPEDSAADHATPREFVEFLNSMMAAA